MKKGWQTLLVATDSGFLATRRSVIDKIATKYGVSSPEFADLVKHLKRAICEPVRKVDDPLILFFRSIENAYLLILNEQSGVRDRLIEECADYNGIAIDDARNRIILFTEMLSEVFTEMTWLDDGWSRHGEPKMGYAVALLSKFWLEQKGSVPERTNNKITEESDAGLLFLCDVIECVIKPVREFNNDFNRSGFSGKEDQKDAINNLRRRIMNHLKREGRALRKSPADET